MARKNKVYSPELKIQVIEDKIRNSLSSYEVARKYGIMIGNSGYEYPDNKRILSWERIYLEQGPEGFYVERRGRGSKGKGNKAKQLDLKIEEDLIAKCQGLEMENEYLKKLSALVSAREQKEKKLPK